MQLTERKFTLRAARVFNDMTQEEAAQMLGVAPNTLGKYERGKSYPDVVMVKRMEKLYGVPFDRLLFPGTNEN